VLSVAGVIGLIARAWVVRHGPGHAFAVDQLFDTLAWNLVTLHQFTLDGLSPAAHVGPLYPMVLAVFYAVAGHRLEWVPVLHMACDLGTAFCVYRVGISLWGSWIGAWAAAIFFLYPAYWTYDPRIRSEALLTFLVGAWLWAAVACVRIPSVRQYVVAGILAGLTILCKPVVLVLAVVLTGLVWFGTDSLPRKMAYLGAYGAVCVLLAVPWSARNYVEFHEVIPVSAGMGAGLWMGSDPESRGSWPMLPERERAIWDSAGITPLPYAHAMYEVSTDRLLREKGLDRIKADPLGYVGLTLTRVWDFWIGNSFYLVNAEGGFTRGFRDDAAERGWVVAAYSLFKRLLLVPALIVVAAWSAWCHRARWRELLPLYLFPIGLTSGYVPFTVEAGRYALPVLPCLMVLSVALVARLQKVRSSLPSGQSHPQAASVSWRMN
jgi:4-amino-4-deoxy-L-arabinose transferase-like glycosyltransferase